MNIKALNILAIALAIGVVSIMCDRKDHNLSLKNKKRPKRSE